MDEHDTASNSNAADQLLTETLITDRIPSTPDRTPLNGTTVHANNTHSNSDVLQLELSRIQGLLGPVLKKRRGMSSSVGATTAQFRISASDEEVRSLRAALEQQEVATSLRQADSSFLPAQFEEKDNLLAEVAKLLEAVEEQQGELEAENIRLRREVAELRAAPYRK
jgi:septal ring factor EnvC (AmiA/AmiB activator)